MSFEEKKDAGEKVREKLAIEVTNLFSEIQQLEKEAKSIPDALRSRFETLYSVMDPEDPIEN